MTTTPFRYWEPSDGERQLRVFISHRYGDDEELYNKVLADLTRNGFAVQDLSLSVQQMRRGPRGGRLSELEIQSEVAARIYTSDIVIAPSRPGVSRSQWVTWEVRLAAIAYSIPILFVNQRGQQRSTQLVADVGALELPHAVCEPVIENISRKVAELVSTRPRWGMRQEEPDASIRFRGPTIAARNNVLAKFPMKSRFAEVDVPVPPRKRWTLFGGRDSHT